MGVQASALVLLIDDVDDNTDMYAQYLEFEGYQVEVARDGAIGMEKARALQPKVIVMDLSMPVLDGWAATRGLKTDEATRGIPIIVLTAHAIKGTAESVAVLGADAYLVKPCPPEDLEVEVRRQMTLSAGRHSSF